jgi:HEXXH motif-containing protein
LEAVLQGVYAHITVVEYWRRRALATHSADSDGYVHRAENLAHQVREALTQITASPGLAPLGRQWVTDMAATAAEWR